MENTATGQRLGHLKLDITLGHARPANVTLRNDGFWPEPGWLTPGHTYRLEFDDRGWVVVSADWPPAIANHTWRMVDVDSRMIGFLLLDDSAFELLTPASYSIAEDPAAPGRWVLAQLTPASHTEQ